MKLTPVPNRSLYFRILRHAGVFFRCKTESCGKKFKTRAALELHQKLDLHETGNLMCSEFKLKSRLAQILMALRPITHYTFLSGLSGSGVIFYILTVQWLYNFWADEKLEVAWTVLSDVGSECYWKGQIRFSYNHFDGFYLVYIHHTVVLEVIEELIKNKSDILGLWRWIEGNIQSWKWVNVLGEGILVYEIWHGSVDFGEVVFVEYEGEDDVLCCIWDF